MNFRKFLSLFLILFFVSISIAQFTPPHRVYGEIQDFDGRSVPDMNVSFWNDNTSLQAWDVTDNSGFYDVQLSGLGGGEEVYMFVNGSNTTKYVNFSTGASQGVDHSGDYLPDQNQNNNGGNNNNPGSGGGSSGGSGGGGSGGGGGGGYFSPPDDQGSVEPKQVAVQLSKPDSKLVDIGSVEENQSVDVSVTGGSSITGFSFRASEAAENVKLNLTEFENRPKSVSDLSGSVYSYYFVEIENLDGYDSTDLEYTVPLTWPKSVNSSADRVFLKYFDESWSRIGGASRTEKVGSYVFESGTSALGYFASGATEEQQLERKPDIQLRDFQITSEGAQRVDVNLNMVAENLGDINGTRTVELYRDGVLVDRTEVSLEPGDSETLDFDLTLEEPGSHTLEVGSFTRKVEVEESSGNIFIIAAGLFVLLVIIGLVSLIYIRETKRANELEQKIRDFESRGRFGRNRAQQSQNPRHGGQDRRQDEK